MSERALPAGYHGTLTVQQNITGGRHPESIGSSRTQPVVERRDSGPHKDPPLQKTVAPLCGAKKIRKKSEFWVNMAHERGTEATTAAS